MTLKQKIEHQAAYIEQLEMIKEEYESLREFILRHMAKISIKEEDLGEIFDNLREGDFIMCNSDRYPYLTKGISYGIMSKINGFVEIINDADHYQRVSRNGFVRLKSFTYNKYD